jgi:signal transduction histidine kinase
MTLPFKLHRLKNGIPLLNDVKFSSIGITISIISILVASIFTPQTEPSIKLIIISLIIPLCGIFIIIWWRNRITKKYVNEIQKRTFTSLKNELIEKDNQISFLTEENNKLSGIIHKDNKLIPSMNLAVTELINSVATPLEKDTLLANANQILVRLKAMAKERSGIVKDYEQQNQALSKTNMITIDSLMMYMLKKANEYSINFKVVATDDLSFFKEDLEFETDLLTILADLIENAIIATKSSLERNIAVHFTNSDNFSIEIFDSGSFFDDNIIQNLGIKKTTSHKNEGGSGIGLMSLCLLAKKYAATLLIEEFTNNKLYKKKVSLFFNKETQIIIHTNRKNILSLKNKRFDIKFETPLEISPT